MKSVRISFKLFLAAVVSAIAHNLIYATFGVEESVFFLLTFVFFIVALLTLILAVFRKQRQYK